MSELYNHKCRFRNEFCSIICPLCQEEEGNDSHFLVECPAYEDLRCKYFRYLINPTPLSYAAVLTSEETETVRGVSAYLFHAFKRRRCALEITELE